MKLVLVIGALAVVGFFVMWTPATSLLTIDRADADLERAREILAQERERTGSAPTSLPVPAPPAAPDTTFGQARSPAERDASLYEPIDVPPIGADRSAPRITPPINTPDPEVPRNKKMAPAAENTTTTIPPELDDDLVVVMVGSDARPPYTGARADVLMVAHADAAGDTPVTLMSIPRDTQIEVPCWGATRVNAALNGCDRLGINGLELVAIAVEEWAGLTVDHVVAVEFDQFADIVDAVGGHEVCPDHAMRDRRAHLDIDAGCQVLDGDEALAWVRSRNPELYVDGQWRHEPVSDLDRTDRQRSLLLSIHDEATEFEGPGDVSTLLSAVADSLTIDSQWSLSSMASTALSLRQRDLAEGRLQVSPFTSASGAALLAPDESYEEARNRILAEN